jgi:hypothetical protein
MVERCVSVKPQLKILDLINSSLIRIEYLELTAIFRDKINDQVIDNFFPFCSFPGLKEQK